MTRLPRNTLPNDAELVQRTLSGDRRSFDILVERYRQPIFRFAYSRTHVSELAEDAAQEAFVAAFRSLSQLRDQDKFAPWLRKLTENVCRAHFRKGRVQTVPLLEEVTADNGAQMLEQRMLRSRIEDALSALSETNRGAAELFFLGQLSQKEIAEHLEVPVGTVKRRINRARETLKKEMIDLMSGTARGKKPGREFVSRVAARIDVIRWYKRLSQYVDAGQSLISTLHALSKHDYAEPILKETRQLIEAIQNGEHLSRAIAAHAPRLNVPPVVGIIRAGEVGGVIQESGRTIVAWLEREEMSRKVETAYWLRTLSFMLISGVPLVQSIEEMKRVRISDALDVVPDKLLEAIASNDSLTWAFRQLPDLFSPPMMAMLAAGEKSGVLESAMAQAAAETLRDAYEQMQNDPLLSSGNQANSVLMESIRSQLGDPAPDVRIGALQALDRLGPAESTADFIEALEDTDPAVRKQAADILRRTAVPEAADALDRATSDAVPEVREAAIQGLMRSDPARAYERAKAAAGDSSVEVRRAAVDVLASNPGPASAGLLVGLLGDTELLVSSPAADALILFGQISVPPLLETLKTPEGRAGRSWEPLVTIDPTLAREAALDSLQDPDIRVRRSALKAIAKVADPEDIDILIGALRDDDATVVRDAVSSHQRLKSAKALPALIEALNHPEPWIVARTAIALAAIGDPSAIPALAARVDAEDYSIPARTIRDAIADLEAQRL